MKSKLTLILGLSLLTACIGNLKAADAEQEMPSDNKLWCTSFSDTVMKKDMMFPRNWNYRGKFATTDAVFKVVKEGDRSILKMTADKGSGAIYFDNAIPVDLKKNPIMRWKWKASILPVGADGHNSDKDDQALGIYVGTGKLVRQCIAYRWETETKAGDSGSVTYGGGFVNVKWYAIRNKNSELGKWYIEERDVAADFKESFGFIPEQFTISISCNSQFTESNSEGYIEWIEFIPAR